MQKPGGQPVPRARRVGDRVRADGGQPARNRPLAQPRLVFEPILGHGGYAQLPPRRPGVGERAVAAPARLDDVRQLDALPADVAFWRRRRLEDDQCAGPLAAPCHVQGARGGPVKVEHVGGRSAAHRGLPAGAARLAPPRQPPAVLAPEKEPVAGRCRLPKHALYYAGGVDQGVRLDERGVDAEQGHVPHDAPCVRVVAQVRHRERSPSKPCQYGQDVAA